MTDTSNAMMKLVLESKALSIWNRKTGPVFWYAAGVPGPFYLNTEIMVGKALSEELLAKITAIIADTPNAAARAKQLDALIMAAYDATPVYQQIIQAMVVKAKDDFATDHYTLISGGERRDWLFSIPFAKETGLRHAYLFKNQEMYCAEGVKAGETVVHVADLINNAASYFDLWLPVLEREKLKCIGTLCVNTRGSNGVGRLLAAGYKVATLNSVDLPFFEQSLASGLIDRETFDEIAVFFGSSKEWGRLYLTKNADVFDVLNLDKKSFERLQSFFTQDPWNLRGANEDFFRAMLATIEMRKGV